jgi:hypothetical protein
VSDFYSLREHGEREAGTATDWYNRRRLGRRNRCCHSQEFRLEGSGVRSADCIRTGREGRYAMPRSTCHDGMVDYALGVVEIIHRTSPFPSVL